LGRISTERGASGVMVIDGERRIEVTVAHAIRKVDTPLERWLGCAIGTAG
jgi:hypothetical protein